MEYINVKEFLNQPREVQKVLLDWWQPQIMDLCSEYVEDIDLFTNKTRLYWENFCILSKRKITQIKNNSKREKFIPLLTEGQLRKFIEDKTRTKVSNEYDFECQSYSVICFSGGNNVKHFYDELGKNLLQSYFKVAIEIIERSF